MFTIRLALLLRRVGRLTLHEAVAIVQLLAGAPGGDPTLDNIEVTSAGTATWITGHGEPSIRELAILLDTLLPPNTRVPAALRYTIARGMGIVEAPPFESIADFCASLHRFEALGRDQVVRNLLRRGVPDVHIPSPAETLLGIGTTAEERAALEEGTAVPLLWAPAPAAAAEPAIIHTAAPFAREAAAVRPHHSGGRRASQWGARAAGIALLASVAAGYAAVELRNPRTNVSHSEVQRYAAPTPVASGRPAPPPRTAATDERSAAEARPAPLGTSGREGPTDAAAARPSDKTSRSVVGDVRVSRAQAGPAFSPAFSSDGSVLFFQTGAERWVTSHSGDMGNTFGPKGFSIGSSRYVSSSKYPRS